MNPSCARCSKTVYPMEKLSCLDKAWHKSCFTCETCNLKLTMKTYKGYNKLPYCNTHYPTTRFTAVSDTPENLRLKQQTRNQSELTYRKDKEDALKQFTQVPDSVSTRQAASQQRQASLANYRQQPPQLQQHDSYQPPAPEHVAPPPAAPAPTRAPAPTPSEPKYLAVFDYAAADDDEVSFQEGDEIIDVTVIDEGWVEGRVKRTGQYGMLPSNYIEKQ